MRREPNHGVDMAANLHPLTKLQSVSRRVGNGFVMTLQNRPSGGEIGWCTGAVGAVDLDADDHHPRILAGMRHLDGEVKALPVSATP